MVWNGLTGIYLEIFIQLLLKIWIKEEVGYMVGRGFSEVSFAVDKIFFPIPKYFGQNFWLRFFFRKFGLEFSAQNFCLRIFSKIFFF